MALSWRKFFNGFRIVPKAPGDTGTTNADSLGDLEVLNTTNKIQFHNGTTVSPVVTESHASQGTHRLQNKDLEDSTTAIVDASDTTKKIKFDAAGTTGTATTVTSSQTSNQTITLPDATDTLIGKATTDTLTNKTIAAASNTISGLTNSNLSGSAGITGANIASATVAGSNIAANTVANSNLSQMAAHTFKGNNTGSTANASDLSATQLTAELNAVVGDSGSGGTKGLVPAPGSGDAAAGKFLKADGTFAVPATSAGSLTGVVSPVNGGTGVANNAASTITVSGNFGTTLTVSGATSVTLPTSGTLATRAGTESLTNKILDNTNTVTLKADHFTLQDPSDISKQLQFDTSSNGPSATKTVQIPAITGSSDVMVTQGVAQTLSNKTLSIPFITGYGQFEEQASTPSTPISGRVDLYPKTDGKFYQLTPDGVEKALGSGSGSGGINYVTNPDFESATTGWSQFSSVQTASFTNTSANITVTSTSAMYVDLPVLFNVTEGTVVTASAGLSPRAAGSFFSSTFYVVSVVNSTTIQVSSTKGGAAVTWTVSGSGGTQWIRPLVPIGYSGGSVFNQTFARSTSSPLRGTASGLITTVSNGSGASAVTVTISNASPGVFTATSHGLSVGQLIWLHNNTDTLPTGLSFNTPYYVVSVPTSSTFTVSATPGGTAINTSSAGSGVHQYYSDGLSVGVGVSCPFTIDSADQAKALSVTFDYNADTNFTTADGTTVPNQASSGDSDLEIFVWDVTNSKLIYTTPQVITGKGSNNFNFKATFQTASNSTSYALLVYQARPELPTTAANFKFDNVIVGPQAISYGTPVSDWKNDLGFTTNALGTITNSNFWYRRVGDSIFVKGSCTVGTPTASAASIQLPSGLTIDSTKFSSTANVQAVGFLYRLESATDTIYNTANAEAQKLFYDGSTTDRVFLAYQVGSTQFTKALGNGAIGTSEVISFEFNLPIAGWSSTIQMSNDTDTRVVTCRASGTPSSTTASNIIIFGTSDWDTHGSYNTSTGRYTVPVSGWYRVSSFWNTSNAGVKVQIFKNGSLDSAIGATQANGLAMSYGEVQCVAGDIIDVRPDSTTGVFGTGSKVIFERASGPSAIAASETVVCSYAASTATSVPGSSVDTTLTYDTKVIDTHGAFSGGNTFTCPSSGRYHVEATTLTGNTTNANTAFLFQLYKNGSLYRTLGGATCEASRRGRFSGSTVVQLVSGDTLVIKGSNSDTPAINFNDTAGGTTFNHFSINRIGN